MTERENIFARIREALRTTAHVPGTHDHAAPHPNTSTARQWLPKVGDSFDEQLALFTRNAAELKAEFLTADSIESARQILAQLGEREKWQRIATHAGELTDAICPALKLNPLRTDKNFDVKELEKCDAGISECDVLIAQTGTVLVTNNSAGGRALSVLPPHHVVLAHRSQLVPDLTAAIEGVKRRYGAKFPSMISFITGPSRTGDIERILVLGAHGPKKLTIICI